MVTQPQVVAQAAQIQTRPVQGPVVHAWRVASAAAHRAASLTEAARIWADYFFWEELEARRNA